MTVNEVKHIQTKFEIDEDLKTLPFLSFYQPVFPMTPEWWSKLNIIAKLVRYTCIFMHIYLFHTYIQSST